ncbi:hypothetical protein H0H87_004913 [Tephrocybe sp. NHM501043]|nr:hypothetical protein H0H87_004913 [Tephrocybe sp. NHM501043]
MALATAALSPSPVNDKDGRMILDRLKGLEASIVDSTAKLLQRKEVVAVIPTIPLVGNPLTLAKTSLLSLKAALDALEDAAEKSAPVRLQWYYP